MWMLNKSIYIYPYNTDLILWNVVTSLGENKVLYNTPSPILYSVKRSEALGENKVIRPPSYFIVLAIEIYLMYVLWY